MTYPQKKSFLPAPEPEGPEAGGGWIVDGLIGSVVPNRGAVPNGDEGRPHFAVVLFEERDEGDVPTPRIHEFCFHGDHVVHSPIVFEPVVVGFDFLDSVRFVIEDCFVHFLTFLFWTSPNGLSSKKEVPGNFFPGTS